MIRGYARPGMTWTARWAVALTVVLALDQVETAPPPSSMQAARIATLRESGAADASLPQVPASEDETPRPSESEESIEGRVKKPRVDQPDGLSRARFASPSVGTGAGPGVLDRLPGECGPFGRRPSGGRAVIVMFQAHRC